ncbi:MAG: thioredoxin [Thermoguttaceae bacterium]|jgi:thioredoxin 1
MKNPSKKHWRLIVITSISILTVTLFVSYLSAGSLENTVSSIVNYLTFKREGNTMKTSRATSVIEHINESNFNEKVLRSSVPVLVDFYAEWCGPCKALAPVLEEMAQETHNAKIVKVNVDENYELASRYDITSIPSLLVFKNSSLAERHVGLANKAALKSLLTR